MHDAPDLCFRFYRCTTQSLKQQSWCASEIARKIKFKAPHIKIIVGGPHISSMGEETMERFPEFDVAVVGEGEDPAAVVAH